MNAHDFIVLDLYLSSFAARADAYVKDSRMHIPEALTPEVAYKAFSRRGGFSVSGYMAAWEDGPEGRRCMTHVGAIDFDMEDGREQAVEVRRFLGQWDIEALLVGSRRGAHLWVTSHLNGGWLPASVMRNALLLAIEARGLDPKKAEVFPKESQSDWGVGALRMPLMRHPKTGVIYPAHAPFDDREVVRITDLVQVMADMMAATSYEALYALAKQRTGKLHYPTPVGPYRAPSRPLEPLPKVTDLLVAAFGTQAQPGRSVRCPFHDDQHASLQIAPDDERAWCKAPECDLYNEGRGLGSLVLRQRLERSHPHAFSSA